MDFSARFYFCALQALLIFSFAEAVRQVRRICRDRLRGFFPRRAGTAMSLALVIAAAIPGAARAVPFAPAVWTGSSGTGNLPLQSTVDACTPVPDGSSVAGIAGMPDGDAIIALDDAAGAFSSSPYGFLSYDGLFSPADQSAPDDGLVPTADTDETTGSGTSEPLTAPAANVAEPPSWIVFGATLALLGAALLTVRLVRRKSPSNTSAMTSLV